MIAHLVPNPSPAFLPVDIKVFVQVFLHVEGEGTRVGKGCLAGQQEVREGWRRDERLDVPREGLHGFRADANDPDSLPGLRQTTLPSVHGVYPDVPVLSMGGTANGIAHNFAVSQN